MNITLAIPENKKNIKAFIQKELNSCSNIKDRSVRSSVKEGLNKILGHAKPGHAYLWNSRKLFIYSYPLPDFIYHCGAMFMVPECGYKVKYLFVAMDANECNIAELRWKRIETIWHKESLVPRKHNKGGQSKERFQRTRENCLNDWFKEIGAKLKEIYFK